MADRVVLRLERLLDAPIDTVWAWLTESDKRARWFAAGDADLREGGTLNLVFNHGDLSDTPIPYPDEFLRYKGHRASQTIVAVEKPRLLAFNFGGGVARFELTREGDGTRLVLTHDIAPEDRIGIGGGWTSHFDVLQARLAGQPVPDFWALHRAARERIAREPA